MKTVSYKNDYKKELLHTAISLLRDYYYLNEITLKEKDDTEHTYTKDDLKHYELLLELGYEL